MCEWRQVITWPGGYICMGGLCMCRDIRDTCGGGLCEVITCSGGYMCGWLVYVWEQVITWPGGYICGCYYRLHTLPLRQHTRHNLTWHTIHALT